LQANRKTREGPPPPDRDAQFRHITAQVRQCQAAGQPVISVDTKKKESVGDFKNAGRPWRPTGQPEAVRVHDFLIPAQGEAVPYGVYDLTRNAGWVSVGIDHDTASFDLRETARACQGTREFGRRHVSVVYEEGIEPPRSPRPRLSGALTRIIHEHVCR